VAEPNQPRTLQDVLARAITRIAQQACRNGESGDRRWPPLAQLPLLPSWEMIGEQYAAELTAEIAEFYLKQTLVVPPREVARMCSIVGHETNPAIRFLQDGRGLCEVCWQKLKDAPLKGAP